MPIDLGRLEPVDLRTCWENEATSFTPWLASEANLGLLGEAIGLDLELAGQEQWVGPFRADILCKNMAVGGEGEWVLIENQLERTDHTHLGQLLTYAAGLHACSIVWIAREFRDEHRAAMDWLNEHTLENVKFFGLEIQLWRIASSPLAPKFNVICRPNDYSRTTVAQRDSGNGASLFNLTYWDKFRETLESAPGELRIGKPNGSNAFNFRLGSKDCQVNAGINRPGQWMRVELYLSGSSAKDRYQRLLKHSVDLGKTLGDLDWEELPGKDASRIAIYKRNVDPGIEANWVMQHSWLGENVKRFCEVFSTLIREVDKDFGAIASPEQLDDAGVYEVPMSDGVGNRPGQ